MRLVAALSILCLVGCGVPGGPSPSERDGYVRCPDNPGSFYRPPNDWVCDNDR